MADEKVKRMISVILSADAAGYSRLMEVDEKATTGSVESYRESVASLIEQHDGCVLDDRIRWRIA